MRITLQHESDNCAIGPYGIICFSQFDTLHGLKSDLVLCYPAIYTSLLLNYLHLVHFSKVASPKIAFVLIRTKIFQKNYH